MIRRRIAVTTDDDHQPEFTGNLFETEMDLLPADMRPEQVDFRTSENSMLAKLNFGENHYCVVGE
jgi:hypothetical protein